MTSSPWSEEQKSSTCNGRNKVNHAGYESSDITCVLIGRNSRGQWVAREQNGLYGGLFINRAEAVRYALFENGHHPEAIVPVSGVLELNGRPFLVETASVAA
jgi:hypothetical protein